VNSNPPKPAAKHLNEPILSFAREDFTTVRHDATVEQALAAIRSGGLTTADSHFFPVPRRARIE
jgi:hypothetical protein